MMLLVPPPLPDRQPAWARTDVPAALAAQAIVDRARLVGGCGAALYVLDLEGVLLRWAAGDPGWHMRFHSSREIQLRGRQQNILIHIAT